MKIRNNLSATFIVITAIICLACGGADQSAEATKRVERANKRLEDARDLYAKTEARNTVLFSADVRTLQQLSIYQNTMSGEAKAIAGDYEKVIEMLKDISKEYDEISRMNLNEKYKNYAKLKSDEYAKRAEAVAVRKENAQAFVNIDDPRAMTAKFDDNNAESDRLFKDAEDMGAKAKKIEEENREIFSRA